MKLLKKLSLLLLCTTSVTTAFGMDEGYSDDELFFGPEYAAAASKEPVRPRAQSAPVASQCEESEAELTQLLDEARKIKVEAFISGAITERDKAHSYRVFSPDGAEERSKSVRIVKTTALQEVPIADAFSDKELPLFKKRAESGFKSASPGAIFETEEAPAEKDDGKMSICPYNPWG